MNKEENILLQYQVRSKTTIGTRYYYFYAETDIENYLNSKNIKYVRYAKDTALNRKQKRILELFRENKQLKKQLEKERKVRKEAIEFMKNCEFDKTDKYIAIGEYQEYKDLLNILDIDKGE